MRIGIIHGTKPVSAALAFPVLIFISLPTLGAEKVTLQLGWTHQYQFAGYYAAVEQGYYAEAGLGVTLAEGGPGKPCHKAMMADEVQYCADDGDNIFNRLNGSPIVALAVIFQHSPVTLVTLRKSQLTTPHDLIGKRVETMEGGVPSPELMAMFVNEGVAYDRLKNREDSIGIEKLVSGEVDALFIYSTNEPDLLKRSGIDFTTIHPEIMASILTVMDCSRRKKK
ncbi:MAG: ABC transporter substrate-binding protein [Rhodospirillales bacterium]|jgi:ABC-type nitrate/sulfonate/bicarbonate transport system substrate-binding protein|nr:ABC transporter substrate-binding protein [Rhodospirillales bacterium]